MSAFVSLLRNNHNYRNTWMGQVVSEVGDHFNNIAVFSLALKLTHSGMVVTGVMLARAIPAILAGPLAGVVLDRFDRKRIMIASDLIRCVVALGFIYTVNGDPKSSLWLLYILSAVLMFASPFFTSGRSSILPTITTREELHTFMQETNGIRARWAARMLQKLDASEKFAASYPYPVHAWRLGREMLVIGQGSPFLGPGTRLAPAGRVQATDRSRNFPGKGVSWNGESSRTKPLPAASTRSTRPGDSVPTRRLPDLSSVSAVACVALVW
jgi:hypothetical protein